jgi:hypothetical protein
MRTEHQDYYEKREAKKLKKEEIKQIEDDAQTYAILNEKPIESHEFLE